MRKQIHGGSRDEMHVPPRHLRQNKLKHEDCNPMHIYLEASPTEYGRTHSKINMHRMAV